VYVSVCVLVVVVVLLLLLLLLAFEPMASLMLGKNYPTNAL
jgi:hypothetical protein